MTKRVEDDNTQVLGSVPRDMSIRQVADGGKPTVVSDPDGAIIKMYKDIARKYAAKSARPAQNRSAVFPKIVIQNT